MKKILLAFILFPLLCSAQRYRNDKLEISKDTIKSSYWQVLKRATTSNPLTAFFRVVNRNDNYFLELKLSMDGMAFVVPRDAALELEFGNGTNLNLLNTEYKKSCMGCGARNFERNDVQGVYLTFPVSEENLHQLLCRHIFHVRLHLEENMPGGAVTENRSDDFMDAFWLVYTASQLKHNTFY